MGSRNAVALQTRCGGASTAWRSRSGHTPMTVYVVTRHAGAVDWIRRATGAVDLRLLRHLDAVDFQRGDKVCGVLPLSWAARICAVGAEAHVLTYDTPEPSAHILVCSVTLASSTFTLPCFIMGSSMASSYSSASNALSTSVWGWQVCTTTQAEAVRSGC